MGAPVAERRSLAQRNTAEPNFARRGFVSFRKGTGNQRNTSRYETYPEPTPFPPGVAHTALRQSQVGDVLAGDIDLADALVMDGSAAPALRNLGIVTVDDFLRSSPDFVDRELHRRGVPSIGPVGRWRDELTLRCMIPGVAADDARVLVACGFASPSVLASADAEEVMTRIGRYLASPHSDLRLNERSYCGDISRVRHWIETARNAYERYSARQYEPRTRSGDRDHENDHRDDAAVREYESSSSAARYARESRSSRVTSWKPREGESESDALVGQSDDAISAELAPTVVTRTATPSRGFSRRSSTRNRDRSTTPRARSRRSSTTTRKRSRPSPEPQAWTGRSPRSTNGQLKFYLDRSAPVVDAPSIGARTAQRLQAAGVATVADLLQANAKQLATELSYKRINEEMIIQWQAQATLACRIPQLRGHDAQILVACGITDADELARMSADELWNRVGPFARTTEGKRIIRGGNAPDQAEVTDWINWSKSARSLRSA
jgi:hypothetical protein